MVRLNIRSTTRLTTARHSVRAVLAQLDYDERDLDTLQLVVGELLGAAYDAGMQSPMAIMIEAFPRLYSVRLRSAGTLTLPDDPFHVRERVLASLTLAYGQRRNIDGTTDLWAEVVRSTP
jgi:hypothetical protein